MYYVIFADDKIVELQADFLCSKYAKITKLKSSHVIEKFQSLKDTQTHKGKHTLKKGRKQLHMRKKREIKRQINWCGGRGCLLGQNQGPCSSAFPLSLMILCLLSSSRGHRMRAFLKVFLINEIK